MNETLRLTNKNVILGGYFGLTMRLCRLTEDAEGRKVAVIWDTQIVTYPTHSPSQQHKMHIDFMSDVGGTSVAKSMKQIFTAIDDCLFVDE